jgi:serine/threonine protein kinase
VQAQSCNSLQECRVAGLNVTLFANATEKYRSDGFGMHPFDEITGMYAARTAFRRRASAASSADNTLDVTFDARETLSWDVLTDESVFSEASEGLLAITSDYILYYEGYAGFQKSGFYSFQLLADDRALLVIENITELSVNADGNSRNGGNSSRVFVEGGNVQHQFQIFSFRGEGPSTLQTKAAFDGAPPVPLDGGGAPFMDIGFDYYNPNDVCDRRDFLTEPTCSGHGLCFRSKCACEWGFAGEWCDVPACDGVRCENGGKCNGGTCECGDVWSGPTCEGCAHESALPTFGCHVAPGFGLLGGIAFVATGCAVVIVRRYRSSRTGKKPSSSDGGIMFEMGFRNAGVGVIALCKINDMQLMASGSQGLVYRARYGGEAVAVKKYFVGGSLDQRAQDWKREASILKSMRHPHVLKFYGICMDDTHVYMILELGTFSLSDLMRQDRCPTVMEACGRSGTSALTLDELSRRSRLDNNVTLSPFLKEDMVQIEAATGDAGAKSAVRTRWRTDESRRSLVLDIVTQTIEALCFIHKKKVIHRDVKPDNVLIIESGDKWRVALADFGLAKFVRPEDEQDMTTMIGSPHYVAPELMRGRKEYSSAVDVYSFGMLVWALVHEEHPMHECGIYSIIDKVANKMERPAISKDCPDFLRWVIESCWVDDPQKRPSAHEIRTRWKEGREEGRLWKEGRKEGRKDGGRPWKKKKRKIMKERKEGNL